LVVVVVGGVQRGWMHKDRPNSRFELVIWVISSDLGVQRSVPNSKNRRVTAAATLGFWFVIW